MKELFRTGGEMPDTNYVFMVSQSACLTLFIGLLSCVCGISMLYHKKNVIKVSVDQ